jgi:hypothetical protein
MIIYSTKVKGIYMDTGVRELFKTNFDFAFLAATYGNMHVALQAFEQFKKDNEAYFTFDKKVPLFGYLRTYAVEKQFNDSAFSPKANYTVSLKQVNRYKHKVLCVETKDFILNIGCTNGMYRLLTPSAYKKEHARANAGLGSQLSFDFSKGNSDIIEGKKYAEITYGYRFGELTHLMILLPDSEYRYSGESINVLENANVYKNYVPDELVEESVVKLKKTLEKKMEKTV